ncbi:MAG: (2Fe-2S)-binding protein [Pseudomonadota bacterium]
MFRRLDPPPETGNETGTVFWKGAPLEVMLGQSVAAALLEHGISTVRESAKSGAPRGPYCLMGACFECLVEIDGMPGRQACMVTVRAGMRLAPQRGAVALDTLGE